MKELQNLKKSFARTSGTPQSAAPRGNWVTRCLVRGNFFLCPMLFFPFARLSIFFQKIRDPRLFREEVPCRRSAAHRWPRSVDTRKGGGTAEGF